MSFNSVGYFLFLPVLFLVHHYWRWANRWLLLLVASFAFYAGFKAPGLIVCLVAAAGIAYLAGIRMDRAGDEKRKRRWLWAGVSGEILLLVLAKYLPFLAQNLNLLAEAAGLSLRLPSVHPTLSIGVSFFVFQAIAYLFDLHLEKETVEKHFGYFLLALAFFPKLLQGPIEKVGSLVEQLRRSYAFNYENVRSGIVLFAFGFFKKVVLADRLALFADEAFNHLSSHTGVALAVGVYTYAFQIFLDFSAYTDMALGSARVLNIRLTPNFDRPYLATSVADFWRRWHITFSRWILDYVFKPLQMVWRIHGKLGTIAALMLAFLVSGIWHGARWTFVAWGLLHGFYLSVGVIWQGYQKKILTRAGLTKSRWVKALQTLITFHLVCFGWILFRAASFGDVRYILTHLFVAAHGLSRHDQIEKVLLLDQSWRDAVILLVGCGLLAVGRRWLAPASKLDIGDLVGQRPLLVRWSFYLGMAMATIILGVFTTPPFIYYRF
jgi:alginate O-acetyltransferase complex protein AlgI